MARFAAGVSTALPEMPADAPALRVCEVPRLLPVVPFLRAFEVLGPGEPPVPLMVLPFESVDPDPPPRMPRQMIPVCARHRSRRQGRR